VFVFVERRTKTKAKATVDSIFFLDKPSLTAETLACAGAARSLAETCHHMPGMGHVGMRDTCHAGTLSHRRGIMHAMCRAEEGGIQYMCHAEALYCMTCIMKERYFACPVSRRRGVLQGKYHVGDVQCRIFVMQGMYHAE
jgi:hypothetical protein